MSSSFQRRYENVAHLRSYHHLPHTSPAAGNHPHNGFYRRINPSLTDKAQVRIRILTSSLSTLNYLRDHTEDMDKYTTYSNSIALITKELSELCSLPQH